MTNPMLAELDALVRLMDAATPGPWAIEPGRDGDVSIVNREHPGDDWDIATAYYTQPANADLIAAAVNFLRTHHATIADMAKRLEAAERDAETLRLCTSDHEMPDGTVAKCHINVGVNVWRGEEWLAFHQCDPDELREIIDATQEGEG